MVKVKGGRINQVSAEKKNGPAMQGMNVNVDIQEVHFRADDVKVDYEYIFLYEPDFATLKLRGEIYLDLSKEERKTFEEQWKKNRQIPVSIAEEVLSALSYTASTVGTLLAYAVNVTAPINLPRVNLQQAMGSPGKQKAG